MKKLKATILLSLSILSFFILSSCSKDESYSKSLLKNMAGEYETLIKIEQEKRWKQISLAISNTVIREIFIGKKNEMMHIALMLDHFLSTSEIDAIAVRIKERNNFEPYIAIWQENGRIRKIGNTAIVPEYIIKTSSKAFSNMNLISEKDPTEIEVTVFYSTQDLERQINNIKKRFENL